MRTFSCSTESALLKILTGSNAEFPYLLFFSIRNFAIVSQWSLILLDAVFDMVDSFLDVVESLLKNVKLCLVADVVTILSDRIHVHLL